jgi:type IV pilus assembly protein PilW
MNRVRHHLAACSRHRGWTLVELMVAMALSLLLIAGTGKIYLAAKRSYEIQNTLARLQDVGRYTTEVLTQDIRRAGYWGLMDMKTAGMVQTGLPSPAPATYPTGVVTPASTCPMSASNPGHNTDWGRMITQGMFGLNDTVTGYDCLRSNWKRGDTLVVRYADPSPVATFDPYGLYIRTAPLQAGIVFGNPASPSSLPAHPPNPILNHYVTDTNTMANGGWIDYEVVAHAYFVANASSTAECGDNGTHALPALAREELDNSPSRPGWPIKAELVTGVEHLQFQYGVQSGSGTPLISYMDADSISIDNWQNVRSVRFWVLVRDDCPDNGYSDPNTYRMGDLSYVPSGANVHYHRALYTSTVALRN